MIYVRTVNKSIVPVKTPTFKQVDDFLRRKGWVLQNGIYSKSIKLCDYSIRTDFSNEMSLVMALRTIAYAESIEISDLLKEMIGKDYTVNGNATHHIVTVNLGGKQ